LITAAGKAAIAVAGLAWGVSRHFLAPETGRNGTSSAAGSRLGDMDLRLLRMEAALERWERQSPAGAGPSPQQPRAANPLGTGQATKQPQPSTRKGEDYVTKRDFTDALDRLERRFANQLGEKMNNQILAIGSLRAMICDTDALLERVLDRLETLTPNQDEDEDHDPDTGE
jgi:hypothetical protein